MTNKQLGKLSAWTAAAATFLFAVTMLLADKTLSGNLSYASSMLISLGYLGLACAFFVRASTDRKAAATLGMVLAGAYFAFINLVYFTQLTTVLRGSAAADVLDAITYSPGTWFFNLDLFGYGIMSLSTFFIGLSLIPVTRAEKWMRGLMLAAGIFALFSILMPLLNLFSGNGGSGDEIYGILAMEFWCLYFIPLAVLAAGYFRKNTSRNP